MTEMITYEGGGRAHAIDYDFTLLPMDALIDLAKLLTKEEPAHGRDNWRKLSLSDHICHLSAHLAEFSIRANRSQHTVEGMAYHLERVAARALMALAVYNTNVRCDGCASKEKE